MTGVALPALTSDTSLSAYIEKVSKLPYLTQEQEFEYARKLHECEDIESAQKLVTSHLRLVVKIAFGFRGYGLPMADLISEGNIGLMHAVKKFDYKKGFRLSTYAMWWIKASMQEYILRSWSLVKIGTSATQKKLFFNLRKIKSRLQKVDNNKSLSNDEISQIASELDVSNQDVIDMDMRLTMADKSLNDPIAFDDSSPAAEAIDFIESDYENQEDIAINDSDMSYKKSLFGKAFAKLNDREKDIILARKLTESPATLEDLSIKYGISRERIRQIEARALEKLKEYVEAEA